MVTVHDVASLSGVSIATVSRALRSPQRVSAETRDRVLSAVEELGYRPNRAASGLRRGRTGVIGLIVPDIENPYFSSLTKGAQAHARRRGYGLVVVDTTESADVESEEIRALAPQIDGIVLASSRLDDESLAAVATNGPCVLVNRSLTATAGEGASGVPTVMLDEGAAARHALAHLFDLGHRRVVYVGGPAHSWSQARRSRALQAAAAALDGLEVLEIGPFSPDVHGGREAAAAALEPAPTAVIAYNDLIALGLLSQWQTGGIRVPADVSLLGYDDTYVTELASPRLTSIGADLRAVGETAVAELIERIDPSASPTPTRLELPPRLTVRDSTAPLS